MKAPPPPSVLLSKPTMCLGCHLLVELTLSPSGETWHCPRCQKSYLVRFWKIKKGRRREPPQ
jgi:hypothetical protein